MFLLLILRIQTLIRKDQHLTYFQVQSMDLLSENSKENRMTDNRRRREIEFGQSLVEFSISAILIILLLVAVADFGRAFFTYLSMRDAAQEGALYGSICPRHAWIASSHGINTIEGRVRYTGNLPGNLADNVIVECDYRHDKDASGGYDNNEIWTCSPDITPLPGYGIQVRVIYPSFVITTPLLGSIIGNTISLRAEVTDTILQVPDPGSTCP
jgi:hypothetical protein